MIGKKHTAEVVPSGSLIQLSTGDIIPSRNNPRHLFDLPQLEALKKNIAEHGVLVPITVYRPKGQHKYSILDGERRYRCCVELEEQGRQLTIPANVVEPPTKIAGLLYMFSIHNFREQWELMPTALGLRTVIETLGETDNDVLCKLTGLSQPQVERCKKLLDVPEKYQQLSLDPNPETRIPSNFWIELHPVLELIVDELPALAKELTRDGIIDALLAKYRAGKIKSVIHFRRIMEAYEIAESDRTAVLGKLKQYVQNIDLETREAFDEFVVDNRRIQGAVDACNQFLKDIDRLKVDYTLDRQELRDALKRVRNYAEKLIAKLEGGDPPNPSRKTKER
jgi:ParB/RepB/Spo0J family partition protein